MKSPLIIHERTITVPKNASGRLDQFLTKELPEHSRAEIQRWISEGQITVNGKRKKPGYAVKPGDTIAMHILQQTDEEALMPEAIPLTVLYEDKDLFAIEKPPGIVVHPAAGHPTGTIANAVLAYAGEDNLSAGSQKTRPGIVHRLDKDTSGIMLIAKNDKTHRALTKALEKRTVKKEYLALVRGHVRPDHCVIEAPMHRDPRNRKRMAITTATSAKEARTRYETAETFKKATLVRVFPETGRTHQIRVHLKSIGYPIIGDTLYGDPKINAHYAGHYGLKRQFLHAAKITFKHPATKKELTIESPLPNDLATVLKKLKRY